MEMTGCKWYGVDCTQCDDSDGIPSCYESPETCEHGVPLDAPCGGCELADENPEYQL